MFFNKVFVSVVDHAFGKECSRDLMMKILGVGGHEEFGDGLAMAFGDYDGESLGVTMLFGVDV